MSYTKKPLEELNVMDDFMISAVASDKEVGVPFCRRVLSVLLQREEGIPELTYDDGLQYIYFYTGGKKGGSPEIQAMLAYLCESTDRNVTNEATREIHRYVNQVKVLPEVRMEYMKFEDIIYYQRMDELVDNIKELLEDYGTIPTEIVECLEREHDKSKLKKWLKLAAHVTSIEEFVEKM